MQSFSLLNYFMQLLKIFSFENQLLRNMGNYKHQQNWIGTPKLWKLNIE